jgi:hypothetical protein
MNFNDEVNWPEIFAGHIARPSLADPKNRWPYLTTMLFVEAGLRELGDQLAGRSTHGREDLGWARITRDIIVDRAKRIASNELDERDRQGLRVGQGAFKYRWPGLGGMSDFLMCLIRYACTAPRWVLALDYGPQTAMTKLSAIMSGEMELADLIHRIATHDLRLRVRLAKYWLLQLALTMDVKWRSTANKACRELLDFYTDRWVPVYDEGLRRLGVAFRPGMSSKKLSLMVSAQISGFAVLIASTGDDSYLHGEDCMELFAESLQLIIYSMVDPGDGRTIADALSDVGAATTLPR